MTNKELFSILSNFNTAVSELMNHDDVYKIGIWKELKIIRFKCWDKGRLVRVKLEYDGSGKLASYNVAYIG